MKNSLSLVKGKLLRQNSVQTQKLLLSVAQEGKGTHRRPSAWSLTNVSHIYSSSSSRHKHYRVQVLKITQLAILKTISQIYISFQLSKKKKIHKNQLNELNF